jgi:hypothetical protein
VVFHLFAPDQFIHKVEHPELLRLGANSEYSVALEISSQRVAALLQQSLQKFEASVHDNFRLSMA